MKKTLPLLIGIHLFSLLLSSCQTMDPIQSTVVPKVRTAPENLGPQESIRTTTKDGRIVVLKSDGTWEFVVEPEKDDRIHQTKPENSNKLIEGKRGTWGIWINDDIWKINYDKTNPVVEFEFHHSDGDATAFIVAERTQIPKRILEKVPIQNIKSGGGEDVEVIKKGNRIVNGKEIFYIQFKVKLMSIPFTFFSYNYTGEIGTIQVVTFVPQNLFTEFEKDFTDFLNGLVILK